MSISSLPHHHHNGQPCFNIDFGGDFPFLLSDLCDDCDDETCVSEAQYVLRVEEDSIDNQLFVCYDYNTVDFFLFPIYLMVADLCNIEVNDSNYCFEQYSSLYQSAELNQIHGLRAPPTTLS